MCLSNFKIELKEMLISVHGVVENKGSLEEGEEGETEVIHAEAGCRMQ